MRLSPAVMRVAQASAASHPTAFINRADAPKYDLMKVALAHHRFVWIHPFSNGNGRVVRLLTYALLIKYGFQVNTVGRLLNPAAVFCADRTRYYAMLAQADLGTDAALENWCQYVLTDVRDELKKVDRLADYQYLQSKVLLPAVAHARQRQLVTAQEEAVLVATIKTGVVKAGDLEAVVPGGSTRSALRTTCCCGAWCVRSAMKASFRRRCQRPRCHQPPETAERAGPRDRTNDGQPGEWPGW
jgi:hypothetical protein